MKQGLNIAMLNVASELSKCFFTAIKGANVNEADWLEAAIEEKEAWEKQLEESEIV